MKESTDTQNWEAMPTLPPDFVLTSYPEAIKSFPTSNPNVYTTDLKRDWAIGLGALYSQKENEQFLTY